MSSLDQLRTEVSGVSSEKYRGPILYKGEKIAQYHSPKPIIRDIYHENKVKRFTSILCIGTPGTGKTTLVNMMVHELHNLGGYVVIWVGKKEIPRLEEILNSLPDSDIIIIFEDLSNVFKLSKYAKYKSEVLSVLTEARHPALIDTDRRVIMFANIHYLNSIEKMWRSQGGWKIYTDMSDEDQQNFNQITNSRYRNKVRKFSKITLDMVRKGQFTISTTIKSSRTYRTDNPFRFAMAYDTRGVRFFVYTKESCAVCKSGKIRGDKYLKLSVSDAIKIIDNRYGKDGRSGLKLALLKHGQTQQYRNNIVYAYMDSIKLLSEADIDLELLSKTVRAMAGIKDKRLYNINKNFNIEKELEKIKNGNNTDGQEL